MKKNLLLAVFAIAALTLNAQKVWNLGGDATLAATSPAFPLTAGIGTGDGTAGNPAFPVDIQGLKITGISTNVNMGAVNASAKTFGAYSFPNRFQLNGAGYTGAAATDVTPLVNMPTQRFLSFNVSGNSTIYAIGITGSASSSRSLFVTDGTNFIGKMDFPAGSALNEATVNYTGGAATLYVFGNSAVNLCLLSATNYVVSSVKPLLSESGVSINTTEIVNVNKVELEVYSVLGKKVFSSTENIALSQFKKGVYVVRVAGTNQTQKFTI